MSQIIETTETPVIETQKKRTPEWALAETQKQFGPTARVWCTTEVEGANYRTHRYRTGFVDDGKSARYVEFVDGEKYRRKGVGASWTDAVESARLIPDVDCRGGAIRAVLIAFPVSVLLWTLIGCVRWALRHV
jgi:hypothetical protein